MGFSGEKGKSDFSFPWCDLNMNFFYYVVLSPFQK